MGKFYGKIGFSTKQETKPGVFETIIKERVYYGEISKKSLKNQIGEQVNDNLRVNTQVSILCDEYLSDHFSEICYIMYIGKPWKVSTADVDYPRITLTLGDIYTVKQKKG